MMKIDCENETKWQYCSALVLNAETRTFRLAQKTTAALFVEKESQDVHICSYEGAAPAFKFVSFISSANKDFTVKLGKDEKMTKTKEELIDLFIEQVKIFTNKFCAPNIQGVSIIQSDEMKDPDTTIALIKKSVKKYYEIKDNVIHVESPLTMLSMDLGTGYYLAMIHDIQGKYELLRQGFRVRTDGGMAKLGNCTAKFPI